MNLDEFEDGDIVQVTADTEALGVGVDSGTGYPVLFEGGLRLPEGAVGRVETRTVYVEATGEQQTVKVVQVEDLFPMRPKDSEDPNFGPLIVSQA